jgi:hypothetical protein
LRLGFRFGERLAAFFFGERFDFLALDFFLVGISVAPDERAPLANKGAVTAWGAPNQASSAKQSIVAYFVVDATPRSHHWRIGTRFVELRQYEFAVWSNSNERVRPIGALGDEPRGDYDCLS